MSVRTHLYGTAALALLLTTSTAEAQQLAGTFNQLVVLVKPGDTVTVTDAAGNQVRGRIEALSSSSMALLVSGMRRELREAEISTIRQRRSDPLKNGALWGFGVGAGLGTMAGLAIAGDCSDCLKGWFVPFAAAFYGGIGAGIGVGIDALVEGQQVIYARAQPSSARLTLAPLLARNRKGVLMSWRLAKH